MSLLPVPGARLYYETLGRGPLLVMAPGATGTAEGLRRAAEHLAHSYTVAIYDRRGFSRSHLDGPQDFDRRLDTDADDLRRLAEHLSDEPATIVGVSSGAVVALHVLIHHPAVVATLVPFEPPAVRLLPDGQRWVDFFHAVYDLYHRSGMDPALTRFREQAFAASDRIAMARAMDLNTSEQIRANLTYWFEHELRQYPATTLDLDRLAATAGRIVPAAGRDSHGYPCREATVELGRRLGRPVVDLPGGHVGCMTHPVEFATELLPALTDRAA
jgi:pimeloyl-ACP methyl ester carboxylesterase